MDIPTFDPLVTDFDVKWDEIPEEQQHLIPEGAVYEHGLLEFENGYVVSVLRSTLPGNESKGSENGLWEAVATRPTTNEFLKAMGMDREPAPELDHLNNYQYGDENGPWVAGDLDSAAFNAYAAQVQAAPVFEGEPDSAGFDLLNLILGGGQ